MKQHVLSFKYLLLILPVIIIFSCNYTEQQLTPEQISGVTQNVSKLTENIAADISSKGPAAWLNYFEDAPGFFMASNGQIVFHDYSAAQKFIKDTLVKNISKINLKWGHLRVNALTPQMASIGSDFHEDLTAATGKTTPVDGYFTATAVQNRDGWKLRDLHWSIKTH